MSHHSEVLRGERGETWVLIVSLPSQADIYTRRYCTCLNMSVTHGQMGRQVTMHVYTCMFICGQCLGIHTEVFGYDYQTDLRTLYQMIAQLISFKEHTV